MLKTLKTLLKQDKEKFTIPKSVQEAIPVRAVWEDGLFLVGGINTQRPINLRTSITLWRAMRTGKPCSWNTPDF